MPSRKGNFHCTVPSCKNDWMLSSNRRLQYCDEHHYEALTLYEEYKKATKVALEKLDNQNIENAINLRKKYDNVFIGGDKGAHYKFIKLLEQLLSFPFDKRKYMIKEMLENF